VTVRIDGEPIAAAPEQTLLALARAHGRYIPALCYMEGLTPVGACRLCMVEVAGGGRLLPACTTPVQDGMAVATTSARLDAYRRMVLELLLCERNHVCAFCVSNGHCELQALAQKLGVTHVRYRYRYPRLPVDVSHPRFVLDHNRCVLCTRCVRACAELEGAHVWDVAGRGVQSLLVAELARPWGQARSCTICGKCVLVCPNGELADKGRAAGEMVKDPGVVSALARRRGLP
jgi:bidirectional [NiFe] hydrogenase diaphorase subunit